MSGPTFLSWLPDWSFLNLSLTNGVGKETATLIGRGLTKGLHDSLLPNFLPLRRAVRWIIGFAYTTGITIDHIWTLKVHQFLNGVARSGLTREVINSHDTNEQSLSLSRSVAEKLCDYRTFISTMLVFYGYTPLTYGLTPASVK